MRIRAIDPATTTLPPLPCQTDGRRCSCCATRLPNSRRAAANDQILFWSKALAPACARRILWSTLEAPIVEQTTQISPPCASETLLRLAPPKTPEDRLMFAVLLDAVALLPRARDRRPSSLTATGVRHGPLVLKRRRQIAPLLRQNLPQARRLQVGVVGARPTE